MIVWAGTSNLDVGMVVEHYPKIIIPERKQEIQTVPGRNGDIVLSDGSFKNYEQPYQCFLDAKKLGGLEQVMPSIIDWLLGHEGYYRLEDSYFPDVYRMAYYSGGSEFISIFNEYGEGTLTFNCAPEKYYKNGNNSIILTNYQILRNPSSFTAKPKILVQGNGEGKLYFNDKEFTIQSFEVGTVGIDVKEHRAYHGTQNLNNIISGNFEDLELGKETEIRWNNKISYVEIVPRWWTI